MSDEAEPARGTPAWWDSIDGDEVRRTFSGIFDRLERVLPEARARVYHEIAGLYCDWCGRDLHLCLDDRCAGYPPDAPPAWVVALAQKARTATVEVAAQAIYEALGHPTGHPNESEVETSKIQSPRGEK